MKLDAYGLARLLGFRIYWNFAWSFNNLVNWNNDWSLWYIPLFFISPVFVVVALYLRIMKGGKLRRILKLMFDTAYVESWEI